MGVANIISKVLFWLWMVFLAFLVFAGLVGLANNHPAGYFVFACGLGGAAITAVLRARHIPSWLQASMIASILSSCSSF